jgi:hypothetical protein
MKLAVLAVVLPAVLAVPLQTSLEDKHDHSLTDPFIQRRPFKMPFVVKVSEQNAQAHSPRPAPKTPKGPGKTKTSWFGSLRTPQISGSCFCAGGSVCCKAEKGVSCDYGVCGI